MNLNTIEANFIDPDGRAGIHLSVFHVDEVNTILVGTSIWGYLTSDIPGIGQTLQALQGIATIVSTISSGITLAQNISSMSKGFGIGNQISSTWQDDLLQEVNSHSGIGLAFREGATNNSSLNSSMNSYWNASPPWFRTLNFTIEHPIAAARIGLANYNYGTNISSEATRFASNIFNILTTNTKQNAMRHVYWQATIRIEFGSDIAAQIGFAHESHPNLIDVCNLQSEYNFLYDRAEEFADEAADLLNNMIGRHIGEAFKNESAKERVAGILAYYHTSGLWEPVKIFDTNADLIGYSVKQCRLSDAEYGEALKFLESLDNEGFNPEGRKLFNQFKINTSLENRK
ncbi:MAG: hypothetical protein K1X54_11045 [Flavobacteriales bacterium]|nr:hypothetical protein [Flavobacteriales bacterium]